MNAEKNRMMDAMDQTMAHPSMRRYQITHQDSVIDWKHGFKDGWIAANLRPALGEVTLDAIYRRLHESPLLILEDASERRALLEQINNALVAIAWYRRHTEPEKKIAP
jgi:hypothetical protein